MFRLVRSLLAWEPVFVAGVYRYDENRVTGQRRAERIVSGGHSPVDLDWLDKGSGHPWINGYPAWQSAAGQADGRYCQ